MKLIPNNFLTFWRRCKHHKSGAKSGFKFKIRGFQHRISGFEKAGVFTFRNCKFQGFRTTRRNLGWRELKPQCGISIRSSVQVAKRSCAEPQVSRGISVGARQMLQFKSIKLDPAQSQIVIFLNSFVWLFLGCIDQALKRSLSAYTPRSRLRRAPWKPFFNVWI